MQVFELMGSRRVVFLLVMVSSVTVIGAQDASSLDYWFDRWSEIGEEQATFVLSEMDSLQGVSFFPKDSSTYYKLNKTRARAYQYIGRYEKSLVLYQKNYNYYSRIQDSLALADAADQIGTIHIYQGNLDRAQAYYFESLALYQQVGEPDNIANIYNGIAGLFSFTGQNDKSLEYLQEALNIYLTIQDSLGQANTYANMGFVRMEMGDLVRAEENFIKQGVLDSLIGSKLGMGYHYDYMGDLRRLQNRFLEAIAYYEKALAIRTELGHEFNLATTKVTIAKTYIGIKNYPKARLFLEEVLIQNKEDGSNTVLVEVYKLLAAVEKAEGNYKGSLSYFEKYKSSSDSLFLEEKLEVFAEKDAKYESEKNEAEIERLALLDDLNNSQIAAQRLGLFGAAGALGLLGFFFYRLRQKNQRIQKQDAEKEVLLKEIHHRVKNNLQVISSLLGLQGLTVKDAKAKAAIQEGRSRVHSMSLIHQRLYKKDDLTGIEMKPYLEKLINDLIATYNYQDIEIQSVIDCEDITLDVETVVPIGLIINELVTNSVKYAFEGSTKGVITTSLSEKNDQLTLSVADDGIGLDTDQLKTKEDSYGHSLIRAFKDKLDAEIKVSGTNGTEVQLLIKSYKSTS